ncbi:MAG: hypothetical protein ACOYL2_03040 [Burkholderiaceae bacterium]
MAHSWTNSINHASFQNNAAFGIDKGLLALLISYGIATSISVD